MNLIAQNIEGYTFESGNRGYLRQVKVNLLEKGSDVVLATAFSDSEGYFFIELPGEGEYMLKASRDLFLDTELDVDQSTIKENKIFVKVQLKRAPGYQFEVTLAPKRANQNIVVDAIKGARIEVYNNTKKEPVMVLDEHPYPEFKLNMTKGNHYTILVRKKGFLAKRMEAYVNVEGCILCFEGVGEVRPGVLDNLTEGNEMGVLLANVELEPSNEGAKLEINNLYYDTGKATLRRRSRNELDRVITMLTDNPTLAVEIGSHTDSRGTTEFNDELSQARAQSVVTYVLDNGDIRRNRLIAKGYGESELKNRCENGVKCSDREHQENRRTEMKIVGKVAEVRVKSLEEMKKEEELERSILELNGQQIKVNSEEELEDAIKSQESLEKKKSGIENPSAMLSGADLSAQAKLERENRAKAKAKAKHKELMSMLTNNKPVDPAKNVNGENLNGFTIVIYTIDGRPISIKSKLFQDNGHVSIYYDDYKTFIYSVGEYQSKKEAENNLNGVREKYSQAYIVQYKDGHLVK